MEEPAPSVDPSCPSSLARWPIQSHPFSHTVPAPFPLPPLACFSPWCPTPPHSGGPMPRAAQAPCRRARGHQGAVVGAATVTRSGKNPLLCPSLCNATSPCPCFSISTHGDFILHQVSLRSHLPCPGTPAHMSPPLSRKCLAHFGAGGAVLGRDSRAVPCPVPYRTGGTWLGWREASTGH